MPSRRALLVGLKPDAVDFAKHPGLTREQLESAFHEVQSALRDEGIDAQWCLTDDGPTAEDQLRSALAASTFDVVVFGAGIRTDADLLTLFERLLNAAHELAPTARIAFNAGPLDTISAVKRWL